MKATPFGRVLGRQRALVQRWKRLTGAVNDVPLDRTPLGFTVYNHALANLVFILPSPQHIFHWPSSSNMPGTKMEYGLLLLAYMQYPWRPQHAFAQFVSETLD